MNTSELFKKIKRIQSQLTQGLVEREQTIKLTLLAALAGEHILLIGPPGTGKSLVSRRLHLVFQETPYFERLLTKFSVPEELFGPLSIQALEKDQYIRLTQGYLPQASIAFLDEIFKANSAILNALLTLLNEREFDNGVLRQKVPLISVIGASNELPEDGNLSALYDRFLFRQYVEPVSKSGFKQLLTMKASEEALSVEQLSYDELKYIQQHAKKAELSAEALQFLIELRKWCAENQIQVSDRRWRKIVGMLQVSAYTNGQSQVTIWDCWLVQHCIWEKPEQIELVAGMYEQYCGKSVVNLQNLLTVVDVLEKEISNIPDTKTAMYQNKSTDICIPESILKGVINRWLVKENEFCSKDKPICEVRIGLQTTGFHTRLIKAPFDGILVKKSKLEAQIVKGNDVIGSFQ
ncbi:MULTISPECIES: AAA family ATPase [unclassified Acinetobacter]|uniref:AAA family ATPase n=1 Tax=unclassified Acinetobacter TaxID=196816 RepID=UPI0015D44406|nr:MULTISPECIES: AAA family ATPase [unclassified Acinetobacter]